jgi:hypothetical protein
VAQVNKAKLLIDKVSIAASYNCNNITIFLLYPNVIIRPLRIM